MDLATKNNERFIVDRRGEPAVVIMSVQDFIGTAVPPPRKPGAAPNGAGLTPWRAPISTPKLTRTSARRNPAHPARAT
jgi:hypothetical protein